MHELTITQAILDIALRHAEQAHVTTILALHLRLGELSGLAPDSIQFNFDLISKDTRAEGARLYFERFPPRAQCRVCGTARDLSVDPSVPNDWVQRLRSLDPCACGNHDYELAGGTGCFLDAIEVE